MSLELDPSGFIAMCEGLARISGKDLDYVIIDQVGHVLRNCIKRTRAAQRQKIIKRVSRRNNYIEFAGGEIISIWKKSGSVEMFLDTSTWKPRRGRKSPTLVNGMSWHEMGVGSAALGGRGGDGRHWSDVRWAKFESLLAEAEKLRKDPNQAAKARGLSKQSWLQIGQDVGLDAQKLDAPSYVQSAVPSNGKTYKNGFARKVLEAAACYIEISNDNPIVVGKLNGAATLQASMDARARAFEIETDKGVFDDAQTRAKRYPGIFTIS